MRKNALSAHRLQFLFSPCANTYLFAHGLQSPGQKLPASSLPHRQNKQSADCFQSVGNPYGKPRVNPYRLKLQAHPYGNRACSRTDFGAQLDTLDETQPDHISKGISGWRQTSSRLGTAGDDGLTNISVRQDLF